MDGASLRSLRKIGTSPGLATCPLHLIGAERKRVRTRPLAADALAPITTFNQRPNALLKTHVAVTMYGRFPVRYPPPALCLPIPPGKRAPLEAEDYSIIVV